MLLLALDNPCLFESFMEALLQTSKFIKYPELVEMCLDDAAEKPLTPFLNLLKTEPGRDSGLWRRQLAALKLVERLDNDALADLIPPLARHPFEKSVSRSAGAKIRPPRMSFTHVRAATNWSGFLGENLLWGRLHQKKDVLILRVRNIPYTYWAFIWAAIRSPTRNMPAI